MKAKTLFLFANPDFDKRFLHGISRLYRFFCVEYGYNLEIVSLDFLKVHLPEGEFSQILIIAGGDGTIHKVINTIPDEAFKKYIFGIIPAGTANEFAKSMRIPISLTMAANLIINPKKLYYQHLGVINDEYKFATGLLYGIACQILQVTPRIIKHFLGNAAFHIGIIRFLIQFYNTERISPRKFTVNSRDFRTNYLLINNASLISKDVEIKEITEENKNLFTLIYLHSRLEALDVFRLMFKNQTHYHILKDTGLHYEQLSEIFLEFQGELEFMLDGEPYCFSSPLEIRFSKNPIAVISG